MPPRGVRKTLKKPAGAGNVPPKTSKISAGTCAGVADVRSVMEPFSLESFIKSVMAEIGVAPNPAAKPLRVVTACSGSLISTSLFAKQ